MHWFIGRPPAALLPLLPPGALFLASEAPLYTSYGAPKALALAALALILHLAPPQAPPPGFPLAGHLALLLLALQSHLTGFPHLALLLGLLALLPLARATGDSARTPDRATLAALALAGALALLPFAEHELAFRFRAATLPAVDALLSSAGVPFARSGTAYRLGGFSAAVEERCSGYSTARMLAFLFCALLLLARRPRAALALALPAGALAGLLANALRVALHLYLSHMAGRELPPAVHEALGVLCAAGAAGGFVFMDRMMFRSRFARGRRPRTPPGPRADPNPASSRRGSEPAPDPGSGDRLARPVHPLWRPATALALAGGLFALPGRFEKRIEHLHFAHPNLALETVHRNAFREWPGGAGFILLENPVGYCFSYAGYAEEEEGVFARENERAEVRTTFRVAGRETESRARAILLRWLAVHRHAEPLEAVIAVTRRRPTASPHPAGRRADRPDRPARRTMR